MVSLGSYDAAGNSGLSLMNKAMSTFNSASSKVLESGADPTSIAEASMDLSQSKVQMAMGAYLIKTQNELMETSLQIFGIGGNFSGVF